MSYSHFEAADSYCCQGKTVSYWWVADPNSPRNSIEDVLALVEVELRRDGRYWTTYSMGEALGEIEALLEAATLGNLVPIDEVDWIRRSRLQRVFEIRHPVESVYATLLQGRVVDHTDKVEPLRIYHGESTLLPQVALGVHLHIKDTSGTQEQIEHKQNVQIDKAIEVLEGGQSVLWGVPHEIDGI